VKRIVIALAAALLVGTAPDLMARQNEPPPVTHTATGVIKKIEPAAGRITLHHEAIAALGWPSMTMPFAVKDRKILVPLKPDQKVEFDFVQEGGAPIITAIH
jgi:Cu(I)/Ag(I) efflux system protein CusF